MKYKPNQKKTMLVSTLIIGTLFSLVTTSLAWFSIVMTFNNNVTASSLSRYFAGGDGSQQHPYILKNAQHIYNLSWLQNKNYFDEKTYFELGQDIDMAGELDANTGETGAIPPIGTSASPFLGNFDGKGFTIFNLWVSSDPSDWKEKPLNSTINVGTNIGLFGEIGSGVLKGVAAIGYAQYFYLVNLEVTTHINDSIVGLIAGYANGSLRGIGVKNGIISFKNNVKVDSAYSLVGSISDNVSWLDSPDETPNGNLLIDPNAKYPADTGFSNVGGTYGSTETYRAIEGSTEGTAYYVADLTRIERTNNQQARFYLHDRVVDVGNDYPQGFEISSVVGEDVEIGSGSSLKVTPKFKNTINQLIANRNEIKMVSVSFSSNNGTDLNQGFLTKQNADLVTLPEIAGSVKVPKSVIWFQPRNSGEGGLAFHRTNNGGDGRSLSLYRYKRENGQIYDWQEFKFTVTP